MMVRVAGKRVAKMLEMASLVVQLLPQLKVKICWMKIHSCSTTGRSSPNWVRMEAIWALVAEMPARMSAGSPPNH